jgi:rare lipoprotein A
MRKYKPNARPGLNRKLTKVIGKLTFLVNGANALGPLRNAGLNDSMSFAQSGVASVYAHNGGRTASGERALPGALTAAHRTLPFGTLVSVTNRRNGRSVVVRINDRGPFLRGRIIDLTPAAAHAIGMSGLAPVTIEILG